MLQAGIVGLPNVGKSTLFNALTKIHQAEAANFPFCTIDPNVGIVNVPDSRLGRLAEIESSAKVIPATFEFVDIAGLVKGASEGAGLGNQFLANIREVNAIVHVVRCFEDENIVHVDGSIDSYRDFETICLELALADLSVIERRLEKLPRMVKLKEEGAAEELALIERLKPMLEEVRLSEIAELSEEEREYVKHLNLLLLKPYLIAANLKEEELASPDQNAYYAQLKSKLPNIQIIPISAAIEAELFNLAEEDQAEYLESLGVTESGIQSLIRGAFATLGLMTYFTAGPEEARAWTIPLETKAPQAAGVIHTDFERGFIKAEIMSYQDLDQLESKASARDNGKLRLEGKDYIVQDGDVIEFKFNV